MLNTELIENLYAGLSKEQQQELLTLLFKRSKQTLSYFKRTKDITLSKLGSIGRLLSYALGLLPELEIHSRGIMCPGTITKSGMFLSIRTLCLKTKH